MPQHEMPFRDNADQTAFEALDKFTQGYVQAIFFAECNSDNPELQDATFADLAPETLEQIKKECAAFQDMPKDGHGRTLLDLACDYAPAEYTMERAGTDFWFTRNGHGAGYWDRELGATGDALSEAAKAAGSRDVYAGGDGKVYVQ